MKFSKLCKLKNDQANLPISHFKEQIVQAMGGNQVVIIAGDTGCGKSTQVHYLEIYEVEEVISVTVKGVTYAVMQEA